MPKAGSKRAKDGLASALPSPGPPRLTWGKLDLQCCPDEGHQRGGEVHRHVLIGYGHVHANQALGMSRDRSGPSMSGSLPPYS